MSSKTAVFTFARMNPPTIGHEKLVNKMKDIAEEINGVTCVYLSHSHDSKKNPLPYDKKLELAIKAFGFCVIDSEVTNIIDALKEIESLRFHDVIIVVGSDRVESMKKMCRRTNGIDFVFNSMKVVSGGERTPDNLVSGISASSMRDYAKNNFLDLFLGALPSRLVSSGPEIFNLLK